MPGKVNDIEPKKVKIMDKINIDTYEVPDVSSEDRIQEDNVDGRKPKTTTTYDWDDL